MDCFLPFNSASLQATYNVIYGKVSGAVIIAHAFLNFVMPLGSPYFVFLFPMYGLEVMHFECDQVDCGAWRGVNPFVLTKCHVHNVCSYDVAVNQYIPPCGGASNLKYVVFSELQHVQCLLNDFLC